MLDNFETSRKHIYSKHHSYIKSSNQSRNFSYKQIMLKIPLQIILLHCVVCMYIYIYRHFDGYCQNSNIRRTLVGIFILDLPPSFNGLDDDSCKMSRETLNCWDVVRFVFCCTLSFPIKITTSAQLRWIHAWPGHYVFQFPHVLMTLHITDAWLLYMETLIYTMGFSLIWGS